MTMHKAAVTSLSFSPSEQYLLSLGGKVGVVLRVFGKSEETVYCLLCGKVCVSGFLAIEPASPPNSVNTDVV